MTKKQKWLLVGILVVAFFFRFYQIVNLPGGLFPDEAAEGLDAHLIIQGQWQPFYERGNGREALFYYIIAGVEKFFGTGQWQLHAAAAGIGFLSVVICFFVVKELFLLGNQNDEKQKSRAINIALLSSFFMAASTWHVVLSRTAFRANLIPLFCGLTFYFLLLTFKSTSLKKQLLFAILTGAVFAGGFYTYIAYRILVGIVGVLIIWPPLASLVKKPHFSVLKKYWLHALLFCISFALVIYPIFHYFRTHPGSFVGRGSQVSIFNKDINQGDLKGVFLEVSKESLLAYFVNGDLNWRHNISGFAFLSPLVSPFFALGLIGTTVLAAIYMLKPNKRSDYWKYALIAGSFWGMLIPAITTAEGIPHGLRSIGTIPWVFVMSAIGLVWVMDFVTKAVKKYWDFIKPWEKEILIFAFKTKTVFYFGSIIILTYISYFIYAANFPENAYSFRADLTVVSNYLNEFGNKNSTYLVLDKFSVQTPEFLTTLDPKNPENSKNQPYTQVDPEDSWKLNNLKEGDKIVFTQSSIFDIKKFKSYNQKAKLFMQQQNKFGQTVLAVYKISQ